MDKKTETELTTRLISKIGPVDMEKVIGAVVHGGKTMLTLNGKRAPDNEALALKKEAEMVEQTRLWKVFTETLRYQAQRRLFEEAKTIEDMNWGKALLHSIGVLENLIDSCKNPLLLSDQTKLSTPTGTSNLVKRSIIKRY
jgi:hypothetical protein